MTIPSNVRIHCGLWLSLGWLVNIAALLQGIGYLYGGDRFAQSSSWYVLKTIPGAMRIHGGIMLVISLLFIFFLREPTRATKVILLIFSGYCVGIAVSIFGSWWITGEVTFGAPFLWIILAFLSLMMLEFPPPPTPPHLDLSFYGKVSEDDTDK